MFVGGVGSVVLARGEGEGGSKKKKKCGFSGCENKHTLQLWMLFSKGVCDENILNDLQDMTYDHVHAPSVRSQEFLEFFVSVVAIRLRIRLQYMQYMQGC